ncbi:MULTISPECIES: Qat anti-phage system ATPase QatA [Sphingobacterium]|uniref:Qat anti-phage system ATPase QatA n=1 Tax=Sphingobacterium TaxID=28453 RepID=UPI00257B2245|nr:MULTISPECIES: Qat anti-phage system ATPase QatA [Sphingobacterium]
MWNDKETDIDLLDHEKIAQTVLEIISDNHLRPLTVGIYGDWGVGKSSVLSLLQNEIATKNTAKELKAHPILFNGWLFQGYEDAKTALMETVVTELAKLQPSHAKIQKLAKSLIKRINWLKVAKVGANAVLTGATGIPMGSVLTGISGAIRQGKQLVSGKGDDEGTSGAFDTDEEDFLKKAEEETVTGQILGFRKEFMELIKKSKVDQIVILVDDLDRCLPKSVIEILEAIRLFLFVEGTTFIISADERMIEYAVREHFPNLPASYNDYTKNYLEKLIQIPIRIPFLNQLQTGNYIKFLMLQNHLKNDFNELKRIYLEFTGKRKTPYDNNTLTYDIVQDAIGSPSDSLKNTLFVADQLSPTLTVGLRGNPRNIKRFLNTLFLRMKISKIYGLDTIIKLNILAKLMLLERFQTEKFEIVSSEIGSSNKGFSDTIITAEKLLDSEQEQSGKAAKVSKTEKTSGDEKFQEWVKVEPRLGAIDLRPYIFISKEKAIGLETNEELLPHLSQLLEQLNSGSGIALNAASKTLGQTSFSDAVKIFEILEAESRTVSDLRQVPKPIQGLLRIISTHQDLEERLVDIIAAYPAKSLGVWAGSQLDGLRTAAGIQKNKQLLAEWAKQTDNTQLASFAKVKINID